MNCECPEESMRSLWEKNLHLQVIFHPNSSTMSHIETYHQSIDHSAHLCDFLNDLTASVTHFMLKRAFYLSPGSV